MRIPSIILFFCCFLILRIHSAGGSDYGWYTEGNYIPETRIKVTLQNTLDFDRTDCPVVVTRNRMPLPNIGDHWVTVVDPTLPSQPDPTGEELAKLGGFITRRETNGHYLYYQLDDIDKDGVWDELFFRMRHYQRFRLFWQNQHQLALLLPRPIGLLSWWLSHSFEEPQLLKAF